MWGEESSWASAHGPEGGSPAASASRPPQGCPHQAVGVVSFHLHFITVLKTVCRCAGTPTHTLTHTLRPGNKTGSSQTRGDAYDSQPHQKSRLPGLALRPVQTHPSAPVPCGALVLRPSQRERAPVFHPRALAHDAGGNVRDPSWPAEGLEDTGPFITLLLQLSPIPEPRER